MFKALVYAYVLGGLTFLPLLVAAVIFITIYTAVPVGEADMAKKQRAKLEGASIGSEDEKPDKEQEGGSPELELNDLPTTRKGWLTVRRTFEEVENDNTSYVTLVRSFLDSRSKDPKRSRPKDMWYAVLKRNILYLYEDEEMSECEAAIELSGHDVFIYPEDLPDAELYAKRNAICLRRKPATGAGLPSVTKEMKLQKEDLEMKLEKSSSSDKKKEREILLEAEKRQDAARDEALDPETPWFIFVRSNLEMEDWYFALLHASSHPAQTPTLLPLLDIFKPKDMDHLVNTLDDQPDVIPMRWLNALLGRIFFSHYRTHNLEAYIIGRLMKKLEKVKRPQFLTDISVTEVSVGNRAPMLSKPMLKELTKEGDAAIEVHFQYKGEIRLTVEATAVINLGARFKSYTVKLVLAVVLKELEGNLLIKVKRPPSNRIWYAFTQTPRMVLEVEPIVSDRQITWGMILGTIESKLKEIIQESVVMPNMDDISFFDSMPYLNRGGIFADSSRHSRPAPFAVPPEMTSDAFSTASAPVPDISSSSPEPPLIATSQSEELLTAKTSSSTEVPSKSVIDDPTDSNRNNTRRKTWFSSVRSDDGLSPDILSGLSEEGAVRGRQDISGNKSDKSSSRSKSHSRRLSINSVNSEKSNRTDQDAKSEANGTPQRSSSRLSNCGKDGLETTPGGSPDTRHSKTRTTARRTSDASQRNRSSSPPSFFSTLKSKAADKQALSDAAKETMRKWGMNWGLKKEQAGGTSSGEDSHDGISASSGVNAGTSSGTNHKPRASYADVRAAVAERKGRDRTNDGEGDQYLSPPNSGFVSPSSPSKTGTSDNILGPSFTSSSARLSTPSLTSKKSLPSISRVNTDIDAESSVAVIESPIHVQPKAKTMTIPGIHAKNRGEIQSMGYVAPTPPPPAPSTLLESRLKNPAIQTVYRFWKNPNSSGREDDSVMQQEGNISQDDVQKGAPDVQGGGNNREVTEDVSEKRPTEDVKRPNLPPPLPPRSVPKTVGNFDDGVSSNLAEQSPPSLASQALQNIFTKDESSRPSEEYSGVAGPTHEVDASLGGSADVVPGQMALASVVSPTSLDGGELLSRTPPPLPPRRAQAVV
ncbi:hypothetical protein FA15DRAFT_667210 [Coprinopsis marcescibilis]|uniref:SMP-LTD domain-containing protein n=1 Tax=Coprinopsis marcescibilis TaxID=230819 RepID=A0A5C3LE49_COPMA|nr:hypothetical protein FA15DRAFT_667210 [Coprinopsis marcescibilis]